MITLGILGSTGSIGTQALQVAEALAEEIKVTALTAGRNVELLAAQAIKFCPKVVAIAAKAVSYTHLALWASSRVGSGSTLGKMGTETRHRILDSVCFFY